MREPHTYVFTTKAGGRMMVFYDEIVALEEKAQGESVVLLRGQPYGYDVKDTIKDFNRLLHGIAEANGVKFREYDT